MLMATLFVMPMSAVAAGVDVDEKTLFEGKFIINSMLNKDGSPYEDSASGDAGSCGRVYLLKS